MRRIAVALALILTAPPAPVAAAPPPTPACDLCVGTEKIVCPTCDGKKTHTVDCWLCDGKGKRKCPLCSGPTDHIPEWKGVTPGRGILPCPNVGCEKGSITWAKFGNVDKCRYCSGRSAIDCDFCLKTDFPCVPCGGRKKIQSACFDCRTTGTIACPLCVTKPNESDCALCAGAAAPACGNCGESGRMLAKCFACRGTDRAACFPCYGTGRRVCSGCYGTGTMRYVLVNTTTKAESKGGKKSHEDCKGKGTIDCPDCQDRKAECWMARRKENGHEQGKYRVECEYCWGAGKIECGGCSKGPHRGFETAARVLRDAGRLAEAATFYRASLARARSWFDSQRNSSESAEDVEKRIAAREATIERLEKQIAKIEEAAGGGE